MFQEFVKQLSKQKKISKELEEIITSFFKSYDTAAEENGIEYKTVESLLLQFLELTMDQMKHPFHFGLFHTKIMEPFNYYQFGMDFFRPLIKMKESTIMGLENLDEIVKLLGKKRKCDPPCQSPNRARSSGDCSSCGEKLSKAC